MQIGAPTSKSVRLGEAAAWPGGTQAVRVGSLGAGHSRTNNQTRGAWGSLDPAGPMLPPLAGSARTAAESAQTKRGTIITSCSWQAQLRHKLKQQQPNRQSDGSVASLQARAARLMLAQRTSGSPRAALSAISSKRYMPSDAALQSSHRNQRKVSLRSQRLHNATSMSDRSRSPSTTEPACKIIVPLGWRMH